MQEHIYLEMCIEKLYALRASIKGIWGLLYDLEIGMSFKLMDPRFIQNEENTIPDVMKVVIDLESKIGSFIMRLEDISARIRKEKD